MFCFSNTGHVTILWRIVSFNFRLIYMLIYTVDKKGQVPLWELGQVPLLGKQNIQAKDGYLEYLLPPQAYSLHQSP